MTHEKEIKFWAEHKDGTKVWVKFDDTGWKLENFPCWMSANMYIVDDEWAKLRKANADGAIVQYKSTFGGWLDRKKDWWKNDFHFHIKMEKDITPKNFRIKGENNDTSERN